MVYCRTAECYLLDDPLSAVDAHVGKHLFEECIRGYLTTSAVILVTHQLQHLRQADLIVVLKHGRVQETGTFNHLVKNGLDFSAFLSLEEREGEEDADKEPLEDKEAADLENDEFMSGENISIDKDELNELHLLKQRKGKRARTLSVGSDFSQISCLREEIDPYNHMGRGTGEPVQTKEEKSVGSVNSMIYLSYFRSGGTWFAVLFMLFVNVLCQGLFSYSDIWISYWSTKELEDSQIQSLPHPVPVSATSSQPW